jgi:adenosylmethionine-8-amino-7-oxononanoate aminotransferase
MTGRGEMRLEPADGKGTLVRYEGDFKVSGSVAAVGQRLIAGVARQTIERTLDRLGGGAKQSTSFWHPFANMAVVDGNEIVIARGEGCAVIDENGKRYLDATASLWYCNVGYGRDEIAAAVERQLRELPSYSAFGLTATRPAIELTERIAALAPIEDAKVFLSSGGSDAVDTAAKLARRYWSAVGEPEKVVLIGRSYAYHGMHAFGTTLGGIPANREGLGDLVTDVAHVDALSVEALEAELARLGPDRVAAFIGEPVVGAGGVIPPPDDYWPRVAEVCRANDVLLIADEVITGFGRLGRWFGCERFEFKPDLLVFAKGVTSGYQPLGGVVIAPRIQEPFWSGEGTWFRHGYTYSGHAAACAAALANLDIIEREKLVERVAELEPTLAEAVNDLGDHPLVEETRAVGLLAAVELADKSGLVDHVVTRAREHGVLLRALRGCAVQLSPPFTITPDEIHEIAQVLRQALDEVQAR